MYVSALACWSQTEISTPACISACMQSWKIAIILEVKNIVLGQPYYLQCPLDDMEAETRSCVRPHTASQLRELKDDTQFSRRTLHLSSGNKGLKCDVECKMLDSKVMTLIEFKWFYIMFTVFTATHAENYRPLHSCIATQCVVLVHQRSHVTFPLPSLWLQGVNRKLGWWCLRLSLDTSCH